MSNLLDRAKSDLDNLPLLHPRWVISGFPVPLEKEFREETINRSLGLIRFTLVWGFTLMACFGIINSWIHP